MKKHLVYFFVIMIAGSFVKVCSQYEGTGVISENGYQGCIELYNETTRVVLEPNLGGRVLRYELNGKNVLYIKPGSDGLLYSEGIYIHPSAGRFDFGPERIVSPHPLLYLGKWDASVTGIREAEMVSQEDTVTGVRLTRRFVLSEKGSQLQCTQLIQNTSGEEKKYCHWSRTFVKGGGISISPLNPKSRYPEGYLTYGPGNVINYRPGEEESVRKREGVLEITGDVKNPKFMTDSEEGWLAYITTDDQLFYKIYPVYPERVYGEIAAGTASIYYSPRGYCEIEPIGPMETIAPGEAVSFTETWFLLDYPYPGNHETDLEEIISLIKPAMK